MVAVVASNVYFILISLLPVLFSILVLELHIQDQTIQFQLAFLALLSVSGFALCLRLIPIMASLCAKKNLCGKDINKAGQDKSIPESLGLATGIVYLICIIMFQPVFSSMLGQYNAAMTSICLMLLLGFADDVLDLRWAYKIALSFLATLPLLVAYRGPTMIIVPKPLVALVGSSLPLGYFYHLYMAFIAVFCTNSINIYAGINGLEVGQSVVISVSVLIHNMIQLVILPETDPQSTLLSIFLILPFFSTSCALLYYNWYPSQVFVGDTYTYFAGMTLAVAGILGHFSKTLMLFFIPQFINFFLSLPQMAGVFGPCPRHRLPKLTKSGKLEGVSKNHNLLNVALLIVGPKTEREICIILMAFQVFCSIVAFFVRYYLSTIFYTQ